MTKNKTRTIISCDDAQHVKGSNTKSKNPPPKFPRQVGVTNNHKHGSNATHNYTYETELIAITAKYMPEPPLISMQVLGNQLLSRRLP